MVCDFFSPYLNLSWHEWQIRSQGILNHKHYHLWSFGKVRNFLWIHWLFKCPSIRIIGLFVYRLYSRPAGALLKRAARNCEFPLLLPPMLDSASSAQHLVLIHLYGVNSRWKNMRKHENVIYIFCKDTRIKLFIQFIAVKEPTSIEMT